MTISTRDQLIGAMGNNSSRLVIDKASIASQTANSFASLWRATGQPGQGAIPGTAAVCDNTLVGSLQFTQQTSPATSYLGILEAMCSNAGSTLEIHDRLMHMGGLNGTVATAQTVNVDISANLATANLDARAAEVEESFTPAEVGREMMNTPRHTAALWTTYDLPYGVTIGGGVSYVDSRYGNPANTVRVPAYARYDATISGNVTPGLTARVNGLNLTDRRFYEGVYQGNVTPGAGRTIIGSLTARF